jgi:cation transporter-like permease
VLSCAFVELDIFRSNIFYSIVVGWLYSLVGFIFNFSGSNLYARLSSLGLLLFCLELVGVVLVVDTCCTYIVSVAPIRISLDFCTTIYLLHESP